MSTFLLNRYRASVLHCLLSLFFVGIVALVVYGLWYPGVIADASGVTDVFLLLVGVDVVLGPLLTLIVFDLRKPELKRDMAVILILQLCALIYGMYTFYVARPVYLVFNADRIDVVCANDLSLAALTKAEGGDFSSMPFLGPELVAAVLPDNEAEATRIVLGAVAGGDDIQVMPQYYRAYKLRRQMAVSASRSLSQLRKINAGRLGKLNLELRQYEEFGDLGYLPVIARRNNIIALVDLKKGNILAYMNYRPF